MSQPSHSLVREAGASALPGAGAVVNPLPGSASPNKPFSMADFPAGFFTSDLLSSNAAFADNFWTANSTGRAKFQDGIFTGAKLAAATVTVDKLDVAALAGDVLTDPGNAGAIPVTRSGLVPLVSAGAETRTLAAPLAIGQELLVYGKTVAGDITLTAATGLDDVGTTVLVFKNAGEWAWLKAVESGSNIRWRIVGGTNRYLVANIADVADAATLTAKYSGAVAFTVAGAPDETRTLANPLKQGQELLCYLKSTGGGKLTLTVTNGVNEDSNTTFAFVNAGDWLLLKAVENGSNIRWRIIAGTDKFAQNTLADPGTGQTITALSDVTVAVVTAGASETRTIANPKYAGQRLHLYHKTDAGDATFTVTNGYDAQGTLTFTFVDAGDFATLVAIENGANLRWRLVAATHRIFATSLADPGSGGTLTALISGACAIVTAGAEARTIANPLFPNQTLLVYGKTLAGIATVTIDSGYDELGNTTFALVAAGDAVALVAVESGSNLRWRVAARSGVLKNNVSAKAASYPVVAADNGKFFVMTAVATFTLPAASAALVGFECEFYQQADATMVIDGTAGQLIVFNNGAATSITFSEAGHLIGNRVKAKCISATKWALSVSSDELSTPVIA